MPKPGTGRDASVNGMREPADASKSSSEQASCLQTDLQVARERGEKRNLSSYSLKRHSKQPKYKSLYTLQHSTNISEYFTRGWMPQKHRDCSGILRSITGLSYPNRCSGTGHSERKETAAHPHHLPVRGADLGAAEPSGVAATRGNATKRGWKREKRVLSSASPCPVTRSFPWGGRSSPAR